jgi:phage shock protein PspC (stress-responsive transcriptional regulator)
MNDEHDDPIESDGTDPAAEETREAPTERMPRSPRRLLRSNDERMIGGVAGGLGSYFDVDPVIFRIAFGVSLFFGGLGFVAYLAMLIFVPGDDGTGAPAPGSRLQGVGRALAVIAVGAVAVAGVSALAVGGAIATGLGFGWAVGVGVIVLGLVLVATAFRGGARWLLVPAVALSVGVGAAAAADLDLHGGVGKREYRPTSAAAVPTEGYRLGVGRLAVDLREINWSANRVLDVEIDVGIGEAVVAVPSDVCVVADAHVGAGDLRIVGHQSDGFDVSDTTGAGSNVTPQLRLNANVDMGAIRVVNADGVDITEDHGPHDGFGGDEAANQAACAS